MPEHTAAAVSSVDADNMHRLSKMGQMLEALRETLDQTDRDTPEFDQLWSEIESLEQDVFDLTRSKEL